MRNSNRRGHRFGATDHLIRDWVTGKLIPFNKAVQRPDGRWVLRKHLDVYHENWLVPLPPPVDDYSVPSDEIQDIEGNNPENRQRGQIGPQDIHITPAYCAFTPTDMS